MATRAGGKGVVTCQSDRRPAAPRTLHLLMVDDVVLYKVNKRMGTFELCWSLEKTLAFALPWIYPHTPMT